MERLDREMKRFVWQARKERKTKIHQCATKLLLAVTNIDSWTKRKDKTRKVGKMSMQGTVKEKPWSRKCFNFTQSGLEECPNNIKITPALIQDCVSLEIELEMPFKLQIKMEAEFKF